MATARHADQMRLDVVRIKVCEGGVVITVVVIVGSAEGPTAPRLGVKGVRIAVNAVDRGGVRGKGAAGSVEVIA